METNNTTLIDSNYQQELNETDYSLALSVNYTETGQAYKDLVVARPSSLSNIIRYKETYSIYLTQRVIETVYTKFEAALVDSWKQTKNGKLH